MRKLKAWFKKGILNFLRPYVVQIMQEHIKVEYSKKVTNVVTGILVAADPPKPTPPPLPYPPITP